MMWELLAAVVFVLLYWLVFGNPMTIYATPFGLPLQLLLEWTVTEPQNDVARYHPWAAVGLSVVILTALIVLRYSM
jgi:hypothetical protein